jgi:hypothetical protein
MADREQTDGKQVPIERFFPEGLTSRFVNNVVVQHQNDSFIISFFEVIPPLILGDTEEERERILNSINSVKAECVARLIVSPQKMEEIIAAMSQNLQNYQKMI